MSICLQSITLGVTVFDRCAKFWTERKQKIESKNVPFDLKYFIQTVIEFNLRWRKAKKQTGTKKDEWQTRFRYAIGIFSHIFSSAELWFFEEKKEFAFNGSVYSMQALCLSSISNWEKLNKQWMDLRWLRSRMYAEYKKKHENTDFVCVCVL